MSYPFLAPDVYVPATEDSVLNPLISVWAKSSLMNIAAVAPAIPLINGWYLQLSQRWRPTKLSTPIYYTALDASWRHGGGFAMFRGSLPLLSSIPIATGFSLWTTMNCMMFTSNIESTNSAMHAAGSIFAGEIFVSMFRYLHASRATSAPNETLSETLRAGLKGGRFLAGFPSLLAASAVVQLAPHFMTYYGLNSDRSVAVPTYFGLGFISYVLFERGFGQILSMEAKRTQTIGADKIPPAALHRFSMTHRIGTFSLGIVSMVAIRMIVSSLQAHLSSKHRIIPF